MAPIGARYTSEPHRARIWKRDSKIIGITSNSRISEFHQSESCESMLPEMVSVALHSETFYSSPVRTRRWLLASFFPHVCRLGRFPYLETTTTTTPATTTIHSGESGSTTGCCVPGQLPFRWPHTRGSSSSSWSPLMVDGTEAIAPIRWPERKQISDNALGKLCNIKII